MTTPLSVRRSDFRRTELNEVVLKERSDPDRLSGQQQAPVATVQNKDERAVFDEVFLPHMVETPEEIALFKGTPKTFSRL